MSWKLGLRGSVVVGLPVRWHRCRGAPLPRKDHRTRWTHLLDPSGKLRMSGLMGQRGPGQYSRADHRFAPRHRREAA
eukprot:8860175-Pyramimonas_sp.AAC.1